MTWPCSGILGAALRSIELSGSSPPNHFLLSPRSLVQENPEVALDCMIYMSQHISPAERAQVTHLLSTMDSPAST